MSICRWSTDDYRCDLYCYVSDAGIETHVAANRVPDDTPRVSALGSVSNAEFAAAHAAQVRFLRTCQRTPIGGPFDGMSFTDYTDDGFRGRLLQLRAAGYRFPDSLLDEEAFL